MPIARSLAVAVALATASALIACSTTAATPTDTTMGVGRAAPDRMGAMEARMKTMRDMHTRMTNARTAEERQALMAEHMSAMQGGMGMMKDMPPMGDAQAMPADMAAHHRMMAQHMAMMQMMMDMMAQRMPPSPTKP